jgi:hypothetical protein
MNAFWNFARDSIGGGYHLEGTVAMFFPKLSAPDRNVLFSPG